MLAVVPASAATVSAPVVTAVSPGAGKVAGGAAVTVTGSGFVRVSKVLFGTVAGSRVHVVNAGKLTVLAPEHAAGTVDVRVVVQAGSGTKTSTAGAADRFAYYAPPAVTGVSPAAELLAGGTTVTVTGSGFRSVSKVMFGSVAGTKIHVVSTGKLTVLAPPHAAGNINVQVYGVYGTSAIATKDKFRYMAAPSAPFTESVAATGLGVLMSWAPEPTADQVQSFVVAATPAAGSPSSCPAKTVTAWASDTQDLVSGLCAGVVYTLTVKARNAVAYSAVSPASAPVVPLAAQVPGVPLVTSVLPRDASLNVSWAPPSDNGGSALTGYVVTAADGTKSVTVKAVASATSATVTGLTNGTAYTVSLTALNSVGSSPAATGTGTPQVTHAPSAPSGLTVIPDGKGHLVASWTAPADNGGSAVTGYTLSYQQAIYDGFTATWSMVSGATMHHVTAASATTATATTFETVKAFYLFSITAKNAAGTSVAATQAAAVTPAVTVAPNVVVLSAATVSALSSATSAALSWTDPAPPQAAKLTTGQIIVAGAGGLLPQGTLRTVTGSSDKNGMLSVSTKQAALSDAFSSAGMDVAVGPAASAPTSTYAHAASQAPRFVPSIAGVRLLPARPAATGTFGWTSTLSIDIKKGPISIQGETSLTTSIDVSLNVRTGFAGIPDGVSISATAEVSHADDFTVTAQGNLDLYLGEIQGAPVTIPVGPVPVEITPKVPVYLEVSGSGAVGVEVSGTVGGGLSYSSDNPTALNARNLSTTPKVSGHAVPGWSFTGEVDLGIKAQPQADLYDAAGPNVEADVDAAASVNFAPAPGDAFLTIGPKLSLKAGLDLDLLGKHASLEATIGTFAFAPFVINAPPTASYTISPANPSVAPGGTLTLTAVRSDGATKTLKWSLLGGTKSDSITGAGVMHASSPAGRKLTVEVSDSTGAAGVSVVTVGTPFDPPSDVTSTQHSSDNGATITWKAPAHTGGSVITGYTITTQPFTGTHNASASATALSLSSLAVGTYVVSVYAINKSGWTSPPGTAQLVIGIGTDVTSPPSLSGIETQIGTVGVPYDYYLPTNDPVSGVPIYWALTGGTPPPGVGFSQVCAGCGQYIFSGTPTQAGSYDLTMQVTGTGGSTSYPLTLTISPQPTSSPYNLAPLDQTSVSRYVFEVLPHSDGSTGIVRKDLQTGDTLDVLALIGKLPAACTGSGIGRFREPSSADGNFVGIVCGNPDSAADPISHLFLINISAATITQVDVPNSDAPSPVQYTTSGYCSSGLGCDYRSETYFPPQAISNDGTKVLFYSGAELTADSVEETHSEEHAYIRDLTSGTTMLIPPPSPGGDYIVFRTIALSADGDYVDESGGSCTGPQGGFCYIGGYSQVRRSPYAPSDPSAPCSTVCDRYDSAALPGPDTLTGTDDGLTMSYWEDYYTTNASGQAVDVGQVVAWNAATGATAIFSADGTAVFSGDGSKIFYDTDSTLYTCRMVERSFSSDGSLGPETTVGDPPGVLPRTGCSRPIAADSAGSELLFGSTSTNLVPNPQFEINDPGYEYNDYLAHL
jgi:hypothetical protein